MFQVDRWQTARFLCRAWETQNLGVARLKLGFRSAEAVHGVQRWLSWPVECDHHQQPITSVPLVLIISGLQLCSYLLPSSEQRGKLRCTSAVGSLRSSYTTVPTSVLHGFGFGCRGDG